MPSESAPGVLTTADLPSATITAVSQAKPSAAPVSGVAGVVYSKPAPKHQAPVCHSARLFTIHLLIPRKQTLKSAAIFVDGKLVKQLDRTQRSYQLNLHGRPYSTVTVSLSAVEANGKVVHGDRVYHTCRSHRLPGHKKFNI